MKCSTGIIGEGSMDSVHESFWRNSGLDLKLWAFSSVKGVKIREKKSWNGVALVGGWSTPPFCEVWWGFEMNFLIWNGSELDEMDWNGLECNKMDHSWMKLIEIDWNEMKLIGIGWNELKLIGIEWWFEVDATYHERLRLHYWSHIFYGETVI